MLEASGRAGGRLCASDTGALWSNSPKLDVGAEFIHGERSLLRYLADAAKATRRSLFTWSPGDGGPDDDREDGAAYYGSLTDASPKCGAAAPFRRHTEVVGSSKSSKFGSPGGPLDDPFKQIDRGFEAAWALADMAAPLAQEASSVAAYRSRERATAPVGTVFRRPLVESDGRTLGTWASSQGLGPAGEAMLCAGFANTCGASGRRAGLRASAAISRMWELGGDAAEGDSRCEGGMGPVVRALADGTEVWTGCVVSDIRLLPVGRDRGRDSACIALKVVRAGDSAGPTEVRARVVVHAAPPESIATCGTGAEPGTGPRPIRFSPPLPATKIQVARALNLQPAVKVLLRFSARAWPLDCHGSVVAAPAPPERRTAAGQLRASAALDAAPIAEFWFRSPDGGPGDTDPPLSVEAGDLPGTKARAQPGAGGSEPGGDEASLGRTSLVDGGCQVQGPDGSARGAVLS